MGHPHKKDSVWVSVSTIGRRVTWRVCGCVWLIQEDLVCGMLLLVLKVEYEQKGPCDENFCVIKFKRSLWYTTDCPPFWVIYSCVLIPFLSSLPWAVLCCLLCLPSFSVSFFGVCQSDYLPHDHTLGSRSRTKYYPWIPSDSPDWRFCTSPEVVFSLLISLQIPLRHTHQTRMWSKRHLVHVREMLNL